MHDTTSDEYPATIFYAFKQEESTDSGGAVSTGWERMLQALIDAKWTITGTWPMRTEHANRPRGIGSNALASSIVLVCRRRERDAPIATRREFLTALKGELPLALGHLQRGNIAPVDLAQAAIGPGMAKPSPGLAPRRFSTWTPSWVSTEASGAGVSSALLAIHLLGAAGDFAAALGLERSLPQVVGVLARQAAVQRIGEIAVAWKLRGLNLA